MSLFHRHHWEEVRRVFAPGQPGVKLRNTTEATIRAVVLGVTSIELRCIECGRLDETLLIGDHTVATSATTRKDA